MLLLLLNRIILCTDPTINKLYEIGNQYRVEKGLTNYIRDSALEAAAQMQADYCARKKNLSHSQDGKYKNVIDRIKLFGSNPTSWGENVAQTCLKDPVQCLQMWISSYGHNQNLLNSEYNSVGYAYSLGSDGKIYWAGVYAQK